MYTNRSRRANSMLLKLALALGLALCSMSTTAEALPNFFIGTGHYYEFIEVADPYTGANNHWTTARDAAAASIHLGANGYLATVTSEEENDFLVSLIFGSYTGFQGAWLGGSAPDGWLVGPEAGQALTYTNWTGAEPNNGGILYMDIGNSAGGWLDDSSVQGVPDERWDPVIGYFVEYNVVPEPSTALMLGVGIAAMGLKRRKRIR